ncbi:Mrp/NBP35 family ATP-binding protein [Halobacteriovorax sp. RT-2-6]|uniref:Mrp/NBP35 family ATP-binding protein n=1 Tax=unclassified Halobacteriovorax TaxID=2639665 RepID=UPI00399B3D12
MLNIEIVKSKLVEVNNPNTGKSLLDENRFKDIAIEDKKLTIVYNRDGITPAQKRDIEDSIVNSLSAIVSEDDLFIKTISTQEMPAQQQQKPQQQGAKLEVGHAKAAPQKRDIPGVKKIIAVSSGKGGVGKSTVSVNLALSLKNQGKKVGLLDADIYGPSIPMLLGQRDAKPLATDDKKIAPIEAHGIKFISFGLFIEEKDAVIWRGPMLGGVLNQFLFDVDWGELDYLVLDLPPGTGDVQLSIAQTLNLSGIVGVSTPQDVALLDSRKGFNMFEQVNIPVLGLIENMSYFAPDDMPEKKYYIFGEKGGADIANELGFPFLGEIPIEIALRESCDNGVPYMSNNSYESRPVWKAYSGIAKKIIEIENNDGEGKGFFSKIFKR